MHIYLAEDVKVHLKPFAANREKSMSAVIRDALTYLFVTEDKDPIYEGIAKSAMERRFALPQLFRTARVFGTILYMLAENYPHESSKQFWNTLYLSSLDKTHKEILDEINDEVSRETLKINGKERE